MHKFLQNQHKSAQLYTHMLVLLCTYAYFYTHQRVK